MQETMDVYEANYAEMFATIFLSLFVYCLGVLLYYMRKIWLFGSLVRDNSVRKIDAIRLL